MVGTHCHLCHINVAISGGNQTEVFLANALTRSSKLSHSTSWGRLRRLTTSVRVNFCVEHQEVYVFARCNDVVETAITDVVSSTVTTDDPL